MPSDGEVDDVLTDWLGSPCCRAFVTATAAAVGVVQRGVILFGEAADDTGGDFEVGGRLVAFSRNIDSEFLLRVRNIV